MTLDNETAVLSFINAEATHWDGKPHSIASAAQLLNGGIANYVWKVQFDNSDSVVVKFFPPFVRARPVVPFAQGRSALEHTALQLVQQHCEQNAGERRWSAPKPLFYDSGMHVLVMEHVSGEGLYDLLKQTGAVSCSTSERGAADSDEDVAWIAKTVMQFLIEVASLSPTPEQISAFHTSPLIGTMSAMFARVPTLASERYGLAPEVVNKWLARAADNESRVDSRHKLLFGDLWPNSLMVDLKRKHLYVVDWELARTGHAGVDFTQFVANLVLMERAKSFDVVAVKALRVALLDEWRVWAKASPESTRFYYKESFLKRMLQLSQYYQEEISDLKAAVGDVIETSTELFDVEGLASK
ncbi:kinase-like domain-containing protein [Chytriomyces cf. hyalinus JEL632]|nr:kinase-like domain-containing protein [Chytriomyces cf. hyalinus JEL632]